MANPSMSKMANSPMAGSIAKNNEDPQKRIQRDTATSVESIRRIFGDQLGFAGALISVVMTIHMFYPPARPFTRRFFELSYYDPATRTYVQGRDDVYFVIGWMVIFTAVRMIAIDWVLIPIARQAGLKRKACIRFAEQGWLVLYYGVFWTLGMYVMCTSTYWLNNWNLWTHWPARQMSGTFKWYYLVQLAFWIQQIVIVNIEERRKDYHQMFTHHIITSSLLFLTYVYRFTNAANVILCLMDVVDFLLPMAKMLKYLGFQSACNWAFGLFVTTWFVARHVFYLIVIYSIYRDVPGVMLYGCYSGKTAEMISPNGTPNALSHMLWPFQDLDGTICLNKRIKWIFLSMLLSLQILSMVWFVMIIRVVVKVVRGGTAEDSRSDDEEDVRDGKRSAQGTSAESSSSGITGLSVCNSSSVGSNKSNLGRGPFRTSGGRVRLVDQSDREALLRRIGCDKPA